MSENNISLIDCQTINHLSRLYVRDYNFDAFNKILEFIELCNNEAEEHTVLWWWNEGARDYAEDQEHVEELNTTIMLYTNFH